MTINGLTQIALYFAVLLVLIKPLGGYMVRVYQGERLFLDRILKPIERLFYRLAGVHEDQEMGWKAYAVAVMVFSLIDLFFLYALLRLQQFLPLNPRGSGPMSPDLAFNTAISFVTNTNWQNYGGETSLSYFTQMLGLTVKNFLSAAAGMAVLIAFIRGLTRRSSQTLGNFWVDLTRGTLYILLPLSVVVALILVSQGTPQTTSDYPVTAVLQPTTYDQPEVDPKGDPVLDTSGQAIEETSRLTHVTVAVGPVASQVAIKQLGTNGGGFFNTNSSHPFENPTPLSNFVEMLSILLIPAALCYTFGKMVGDPRQGWAVLAAMTIIFVAFLALAEVAEQSGNPRLTQLGIDQAAGNLQSGGNMEGKETRFGVVNSALWATATTAASNGSVNSMHDSYTPLGGLVPLIMMQFGEVIFGGVGSGLYGMLVFVIVAVFIAGLMVGRTPEYLGKKIEVYEMKMASIVILIMPIVVLTFTALAVVTAAGRAGISSANSGPHGFSEILYAYSSQANNNGSAFAGLSGNHPFWNTTGAFAMFFGRFLIAIPTLALAGSLARKKIVPTSAGTLPTHTPLFVVLLIGVVIIIAALVFFPANALGPIVEHLLLYGHL